MAMAEWGQIGNGVHATKLPELPLTRHVGKGVILHGETWPPSRRQACREGEL